MTISAQRWNGNDIQSDTYVALIDEESFRRTAQQVQVQPPGAWPVHVRANQQPRVFSLTISIISGDLNTGQRQLQEWFAPGTEADLEIDEDGTTKVITAVVLTAQRYANDSSTLFGVTLGASDPRLRALNPLSAASLITSSGGGFSVTNPGNSTIDDPVITLRPVANKAAASGYLYMLESVIAWRAARPAANYAVEITEGWDHATEVGAGRSQADGDDVRVLVDGVEVPRWFGEHADNDANSAAPKIWINMDFSPRRTAVLQTAMTLASPTEGGDIEVVKGGTLGWPRSGALLIDNEVVTYSGRTEYNANGRAAFTGIVRGARNTTVATHSATTTMYWQERRVQIVYGNTGVSAPDPRSDLKPMLDLTTNTVSNERHEWINFADSASPARSMQWLTRSRTFDDQYDKILAPTASPLTALTFEYQSGGAVSGKPVGNTYYRDFPTGTGSSGGNVATVTRVLADTLGLWVYGIDDAGQDVVLQKFAGALTSASANITAPTNPVYRLECWAFNQVFAHSPPGAYTASLGSITATHLGGPAQQFTVGTEPIDVVGLQAVLVYSFGTHAGHTMTAAIYPDSGSDAPWSAAGSMGTSAAFTLSGASETASFVFSTPVTLQAGKKYWLSLAESTDTGMIWNIGPDKYSGGKVYYNPTVHSQYSYPFGLMARPYALADSLARADDISYADDSDQVTVDGVTVHLSTSESPYVALKSRQGIYRFASGTLYNETTGDSVKVEATCAMSNELRISIGEGSAVNIDNENGTSFAVEYGDADRKFTLAPGNNSLRFVESGLVGVNVAVDAYARWE